MIRTAKALNKLWARRGSVFADRYHDHILKTPREVRNALRYVFGNGRKHATEGREITVPQAIDTFSAVVHRVPRTHRRQRASRRLSGP